MSEQVEFVVRAALIGAGATVLMDVWAVFLKRCFGVPSLDYGLVGRWLGHLPRGRFVHDSIARTPALRREALLGWTAHYVIGIVFAAGLLAVCGLDWARNPTPLPALAAGLLTFVAPFLILQPGMGAGIAASKTPDPTTARLRSAMAHAAFGLGLYAAALVTALL